MNIQEDKKTDQQFDLHVELNHNDIKNHFEQEVKKMSKTTKMKGFRPGKTPPALLKRMYGPDMMARSVNELIQNETQKYLEENALEVFGPLVITDMKKDFQFSPDVKEDFTATLRFLKPFDTDSTLETLKEKVYYYLPMIEADKMEEHIQEILLDNGTLEESDTVDEKSLISLKIEQPDETAEEITFKQSVEHFNSENLRDSLIGKKVGDTLDFIAEDLSDNEQYLQINILDKLNKVSDETAENTNGDSDDTSEVKFTKDSQLKAQIQTIEKRVAAEINDEFFQKIDPRGEINSREKLEELIKNGTQNNVRPQSNILFFMQLKEVLQESFPLDVDDDFVKEFFIQNYRVNNHALEHHLDELREDLSWMRIKDALDKEFNLEVQEREIRVAMGRDMMQYFGGYNLSQQILNSFIDRQMKDKKQVDQYAERIYLAKIAETMVENHFCESKEIRVEELNSMIEAMNAQVDAKNAEHNHHHHHEDEAVIAEEE